jgi:hypothetical protein
MASGIPVKNTKINFTLLYQVHNTQWVNKKNTKSNGQKNNGFRRAQHDTSAANRKGLPPIPDVV